MGGACGLFGCVPRRHPSGQEHDPRRNESADTTARSLRPAQHLSPRSSYDDSLECRSARAGVWPAVGRSTDRGAGRSRLVSGTHGDLHGRLRGCSWAMVRVAGRRAPIVLGFSLWLGVVERISQAGELVDGCTRTGPQENLRERVPRPSRRIRTRLQDRQTGSQSKWNS